MASSDSSSSNDKARLLPKGFTPSDNQVIIGRGKRCLEHEGNKRLRNIVKAELQDYVNASSKVDKSLILLRILRQIRQNNKDGIGFVKQDLLARRWLELTEFASRVAIAQVFRDTLSNRYKSSKQSKQSKRRVQRLSSIVSLDSITANKAMVDSVLYAKNTPHPQSNFTGMWNVPSMSVSEIVSNALDLVHQGDPNFMNHGQLPGMQSQPTMQEQMMLQHQLQMMMNRMPMAMPVPSQYEALSPRAVTPGRNNVGFIAQYGQNTSPDEICFPNLEPLPVDDSQWEESIDFVEDDDFLEVFHCMPLTSLKVALSTIP